MINIQDNIAEMVVGNISIGSVYVGNQLVWEKSSPALPYDAQVEWICSDGKTYIDTGVKPSNTVRFEIVMDIPELTTTGIWPFGARTSSSVGKMCLFYNTNDKLWIWHFGNRSTSKTEAITVGRYTFDNHSTSAARILNVKHGSTTTSYTNTGNTFTCANNIFLFAMNTGTGAVNRHADEKLVSAKFWSGSTLVRDYIPVRKDGVGYLWDKVTEALYGNANSVGEFTYGNDVT